MPIADLQVRQGNVNLVAEVVEKGEIRTFEKFGKSGKVCNAKIKDDTGTVTLTLWNDDVDKINVGDKIKLTNGWVGEWQGEKQLSAGKFGKLEVVEKAAPGAAPETPAEKTPEPEEESTDEPIEEDVVE